MGTRGSCGYAPEEGFDVALRLSRDCVSDSREDVNARCSF
jgi:hypothetical protein